jgi:hypothetical protein
MDVTLTIRVWLAKLGRSFVHIGILAIPVSGLIISLSSLVPGLDINPAIDPDGFARVATTVSLANLAGLVAGVILLLGFLALREYMSNAPVGFWSFAGMVSSTGGLGLFLPFVGIFAFAGPVAARLYLLGNKGAITVVADSVSPSNTTALVFGGLSILLFVAGSIIFGSCIWRCGKLPRWAAVPYAFGVPLLIVPFYSFANFAGGLLLLTSGIWMALNVWKKPQP